MIGSALGPFLAVSLSAFGFWIKSILKERKELKEFLRQIEISMARSLNDTFVAREQLKWFLKRVENLITEAQAINDDKTFFLNRINFPTTREIYRDAGMPNFKIKSYYLHNKLMWVDAGVKEMNETVSNLKENFSDLVRQNEVYVAIMRDNPNPRMQREAYVRNLESFSEAINSYISKNVQQGIEVMLQVKIYNEKMRSRYGSFLRWKHEGTRLKYFNNKREQKEFSRNLDSVERIDRIIQKEVDSALSKAENRSQKLKTD